MMLLFRLISFECLFKFVSSNIKLVIIIDFLNLISMLYNISFVYNLLLFVVMFNTYMIHMYLKCSFYGMQWYVGTIVQTDCKCV